MNTRIVPARETHVPALLEMERVCFGGVYAAHRFERRQLRHYVHASQARTFVSLLDGRTIGAVIGWLGGGSHRHIGRVVSLAVLPGFRRQGIGSRLLQRLFRAMKRTSVRVVRAEVWTGNRGSLTAFEAAGFRRERRLRDYYGSGADAVRLRLDLDRTG